MGGDVGLRDVYYVGILDACGIVSTWVCSAESWCKAHKVVTRNGRNGPREVPTASI